MLGIEFACLSTAYAQADVLVSSEWYSWPHRVIERRDGPDILVATNESELGNDVWVRPVERAVVDLGYPYYQLVDMNGDGQVEVLSNGVDVVSGIDVAAHAPETHDGYVSGIEWQGDVRFDVNGDGRNDLLTYDRVALSDGVRFVALDVDWGPGRILPAGDLDGDGRDDLVRVVYQMPWQDAGFRLGEAHYELFLGSDLREDGWRPRWSFRPERHPATVASAFLDTDGDGTVELVAFLEGDGNDFEVGVFGDLLDSAGPRKLARGFGFVDGTWNDPSDPPLLQNVGDWDGDGDDDVVVHSLAVAGRSRLAVLDADLDDPTRLVTTFDLREGEDPAYGEYVSLGSEFVGDFDGDGDRDLAVSRPYGVAFYGVDPTLLEGEPAAPSGTLLGGCSGGGGGAIAGVAGISLLGLRRRRGGAAEGR